MGLSLHYRGQIRDYALIEDLISECADICKSLEWDYHIWNKESSINDDAHIDNSDFIGYTMEDLKGISILPKECEPVDLAFFPSGKLCSPIKLQFNNAATNDLMVAYVSTKTQYAGMDIHVAVLKLLEYLKDKYFSFFELSDEGMYWETKDIEVLKSQFARYNFIVNSVRNALSDFKALPGETAESLTDRLEELLKNKFGSNEQ
ncbi:MAG: hypothetical protein WAT20_09320 [Ferruginibacter sp.]|nr:hypothetical protein [Chitinophagaceae bacterium]